MVKRRATKKTTTTTKAQWLAPVVAALAVPAAIAGALVVGGKRVLTPAEGGSAAAAPPPLVVVRHATVLWQGKREMSLPEVCAQLTASGFKRLDVVSDVGTHGTVTEVVKCARDAGISVSTFSGTAEAALASRGGGTGGTGGAKAGLPYGKLALAGVAAGLTVAGGIWAWRTRS